MQEMLHVQLYNDEIDVHMLNGHMYMYMYLGVEGNAVQVVVEFWLVECYHVREHCQVLCTEQYNVHVC